jgi:hypothetical protein
MIDYNCRDQETSRRTAIKSIGAGALSVGAMAYSVKASDDDSTTVGQLDGFEVDSPG